MARKRRENSISGQVNRATRFLTVALVIPAIISLVLLMVYAAWYQKSIYRMDTVASLKPLVDTSIPEEVWEIVAGRTDFANSNVYTDIHQVIEILEDLIAGGGEEGKLELTIARRTMDTLTQYVEQIEYNLELDLPIVNSERTLEEVRGVAQLVVSMLDDYITGQMTMAASNVARMSRLVILSVLVELMMLLAALVFSARTQKRMERFVRQPIGRLEYVAGMMAAGNLQARVPPTTVSELEHLTEGINIMADRLESLIIQNRKEQDNLRKSELRTLQAQINPHFLYNTLDAIIWQAEAGHSDQVIALTRAMSDFFRISLSSGEDWIPVRQEIKHLAGYLSIQKTRYRDILTYDIDVDEALGEVYVLKLLLQPLVENAIYHGIKFKRGGGHISVTGRCEGDRLIFTVRDTGKGMSPEQLMQVRQCMRGEKPVEAAHYTSGGSGFGLSNVDQRIRLYYNQPEGLVIESGEGGTTVSLCVPMKRKEDLPSD